MKENIKKFRKAQNLVEYILIATMFAVVCVTIIGYMDLSKLKNYIFARPGIKDASGKYTIEIEPMTKGPPP